MDEDRTASLNGVGWAGPLTSIALSDCGVTLQNLDFRLKRLEQLVQDLVKMRSEPFRLSGDMTDSTDSWESVISEEPLNSTEKRSKPKKKKSKKPQKPQKSGSRKQPPIDPTWLMRVVPQEQEVIQSTVREILESYKKEHQALAGVDTTPVATTSNDLSNGSPTKMTPNNGRRSSWLGPDNQPETGPKSSVSVACRLVDGSYQQLEVPEDQVYSGSDTDTSSLQGVVTYVDTLTQITTDESDFDIPTCEAEEEQVLMHEHWAMGAVSTEESDSEEIADPVEPKKHGPIAVRIWHRLQKHKPITGQLWRGLRDKLKRNKLSEHNETIFEWDSEEDERERMYDRWVLQQLADERGVEDPRVLPTSEVSTQTWVQDNPSPEPLLEADEGISDQKEPEAIEMHRGWKKFFSKVFKPKEISLETSLDRVVGDNKVIHVLSETDSGKRWVVRKNEEGDAVCVLQDIPNTNNNAPDPSNELLPFPQDEERPPKKLVLSCFMRRKGLPFVDQGLYYHLKNVNLNSGTVVNTHMLLCAKADLFLKQFRVSHYPPHLMLEVKLWTVLAAMLPLKSELLALKMLGKKSVVKPINDVASFKRQGQMVQKRLWGLLPSRQLSFKLE